MRDKPLKARWKAILLAPWALCAALLPPPALCDSMPAKGTLAEQPATALAPGNAAAPEQAVRRGTLFEIRRGDRIAYLFGTVHVGKPGFPPLEPDTARAFAQAGTLAVEIDIRDTGALAAALRRYGVLSGGDTLARRLDKSTMARLNAILAKFGVPPQAVAGLKPWMVANLLISVALERSGYSAANGTEIFLLRQASETAKPVVALESAAYQMSLFDRLSAAEQATYLKETLDQLENGKALDRAARMLDAWNRADSESVLRLAREELEEKTFSARFAQHELLNRRNPEMAARIVDMLKEKEPAFVAVGMLHLLGEGSVPELLRKRGIEVRKIY